MCLKTLRLIHRLSKKLNNDFNSKNLQLLKKNTKILGISVLTSLNSEQTSKFYFNNNITIFTPY